MIRVRRQVKRLGRTWVFALPKNDKERIVPMSPRLAELADEHIKVLGWVIWKPAIVAAGVIPPPTKDARGRWRYEAAYTAGMHALRHYYASITLADGVNIKELSGYLGHPDPGFTLQMYTHMLPSSHDRARQAVDRRLERLALRLTEQRRSRVEIEPADPGLDFGPDLF